MRCFALALCVQHILASTFEHQLVQQGAQVDSTDLVQTPFPLGDSDAVDGAIQQRLASLAVTEGFPGVPGFGKHKQAATATAPSAAGPKDPSDLRKKKEKKDIGEAEEDEADEGFPSISDMADAVQDGAAAAVDSVADAWDGEDSESATVCKVNKSLRDTFTEQNLSIPPGSTPGEAATWTSISVAKNAMVSGGLVAYYDVGDCGSCGPKANWKWCDKERFFCRTTVEVPTDVCSTGEAALLGTLGSGSEELPIQIDDCAYLYFATYSCTVPTPAPSPVPAPAPAQPSSAWATAQAPAASVTKAKEGKMPKSKKGILFAYWDDDDCGVSGDDANWGWCGHKKFDCQKEVDVPKDQCESGKAELIDTQGTGEYGSLIIENCTYAYFATYNCTACVTEP